MIEEHAHQIANPGLTGRRQHLHFGSLLGALHSAPFGRSKFLLQPPVRIEFQILQPLFDNRSLDRIQFLSAPARRNPPVEIALIPVACRPRTTVLAFVDKFFQTEVFDHIIHRDSTECVALIGVDGRRQLRTALSAAASVLYWSSVPSCLFFRTRLPFGQICRQLNIQTGDLLPFLSR